MLPCRDGTPREGLQIARGLTLVSVCAAALAAVFLVTRGTETAPMAQEAARAVAVNTSAAVSDAKRIADRRATLELRIANAAELEALGATARVFVGEPTVGPDTSPALPSYVTQLSFFGAGAPPRRKGEHRV